MKYRIFEAFPFADVARMIYCDHTYNFWGKQGMIFCEKGDEGIAGGSPLSLPSKKCIVCSRTINYNNHIMPTGNGNATKILFSSRFSGSIMRSIWDVRRLDNQASQKDVLFLSFPQQQVY